MAFIKCDKCGEKINDTSPACPFCGCLRINKFNEPYVYTALMEKRNEYLEIFMGSDKLNDLKTLYSNFVPAVVNLYYAIIGSPPVPYESVDSSYTEFLNKNHAQQKMEQNRESEQDRLERARFYRNEAYEYFCQIEKILYENNDTRNDWEKLKKKMVEKGEVQRLTSRGCYVATCVYGSYDCPEVWTLRRFRDYNLNNKVLGRLFIKIYYAVSPKIVKIFGNNNKFKLFNKKILDRLVQKLNSKGYKNTKYEDKY